MIKKPFVIKNPVCKRCWCCRQQQWPWPAWGHLFLFVRVRMPEASILQKEGSLYHTSMQAACQMPIQAESSLLLLCLSFPPPVPVSHLTSSFPQPAATAALFSPVTVSIQLKPSLLNNNPKALEAEQRGWSSQESSSWNCGQMKHRTHCTANRGGKARINWPISVYCLGAVAENS